MSPNYLIFIGAAIGFGLAAIFVVLTRRHMSTWKAGVLMLLCCTVICFARAQQFMSVGFDDKVFWYKLLMAGFAIIPTAFLFLALRYAGLGYLITPRTQLIVNAFPALTILFAITNEFHGWFWDPTKTVLIVHDENFLSLVFTRFWYWVFVAHSYALMGIGCYILYRLIARSPKFSGWQTTTVIIAAILASLGPALDILGQSPLAPFSTTLLGLSIGAILMIVAMSPLRQRDMLFITREAIIQNMSDSIIVVNKDHVIVDINPAAEKLTNKPSSHFVGKSLTESFPELKTIWADQTSMSGEIVLSSGAPVQTLDFRISTIEDWQKNIISKVIVLRDITERKQAEQERMKHREAEQKFSQKLTTLATVTQDLSKTLTLNELCRRAIELGRDPLGFDRLAIWFVSKDHDRMTGTYGVSIEGDITDERGVQHPITPTTRMMPVLEGREAIQSYENAPLYRADGQKVGSGTRITAGLWDGQTVIGFLSVDNFIRQAEFSEHDKEIIRLYASSLGHLCTLKRAQEALFQLTETLEHRVRDRTTRLETANKELEAFAYSISHDLRTPLRAIDGYTSLLVENYAPSLDVEGKRISEIIQKETHRMGKLIDDLLAFSRFSRTEMHTACIDMETLAKAVAKELIHAENADRVEIVIEKLAPIWGDYGLLQQVWVNLISNALKFTSKREKARIHVHNKQDDSGVTYCIWDNGVGFDMAYANKLFGVFQRLHSEQEFPGTGAGLAIVQRIIIRHGGQIWAESEEGVGTTFFFILPNKA